MTPVFAKIRGQAFGWGKTKLVFSKAFNKLEPEAQMSILNQVMVQCRDAHKAAERNHRIKRQHEDARNAESIQAKA